MTPIEIVSVPRVQATGQALNAGMSAGLNIEMVFEPIPPPPLELALAAIARGECEPAKYHLERLLEAEPTNDMIVGMLGAVYVELGDLQRAEQLFRTALTANPTSELARLQLGLVLLDTKRREEALKIWRAGTYGENQFLIDFYSGGALLQLNRPDEALAMLQRAQQMMPVDHVHYLELLESLTNLST